MHGFENVKFAARNGDQEITEEYLLRSHIYEAITKKRSENWHKHFQIIM